MTRIDKSANAPAPAKAPRQAAPAGEPAAKPAASADALVLSSRSAERDLEAMIAAQEAHQAKAASLRSWSMGAGLLGFCSMFAAAASGPALPFIMGAGLLAMVGGPVVLGSMARAEEKQAERLEDRIAAESY